MHSLSWPFFDIVIFRLLCSEFSVLNEQNNFCERSQLLHGTVDMLLHWRNNVVGISWNTISMTFHNGMEWNQWNKSFGEISLRFGEKITPNKTCHERTVPYRARFQATGQKLLAVYGSQTTGYNIQIRKGLGDNSICPLLPIRWPKKQTIFE